ncbi:MAG TPA: glycosyltransferase family 2 protein [Candidatus Acidoferrales bacterium]|nr:glycosyltransferase family 2 protein [Candidatus Acidoferrales bacterium]
MNRLAVTLITKNEERNLPRVLASLEDLADELVVVDSGSSDRTLQIVTAHGAKIYIRGWSGFAEQRNFAGEQCTCEWVLALDADEELSEPLRASLREWKERPAEFDAYEFARCAIYLGRWIRHSGWYPDWKTRLYRRGVGQFAGATHDAFRTGSPIGRLAGDLLHHAFDAPEEHEATVQSYSASAAAELFANGRRRWRAALYVAPAWTFARKIFLQGALFDGWRGYRIACMSSRYTWLKYRKLGALVRQGRSARAQNNTAARNVGP